MNPEQKKTLELLDKATNVMAFYQKECLIVHALCDRAEVPTHHEGERLTMSQRVTVLESAWRDIRTLYRGCEPPKKLQ